MPLFCCGKCQCIENTALSNYWTRNDPKIWPAEFVGKALCSECGPPVYLDGTKSEYGVWHNRFKKQSAVGMLIDQNNNLWSQEQIDNNELPRGYKIIGVVKAIN